MIVVSISTSETFCADDLERVVYNSTYVGTIEANVTYALRSLKQLITGEVDITNILYGFKWNN